MRLLEINLKNFGKFHEKAISFSNGINVIYGRNEAGKTTLATAIGALLFGMDRQRGRAAEKSAYMVYQPWENMTYYAGALKFETGGKSFCIERNFYHGEKSVHFYCETDGETLSVEDGDLEMLLEGMNFEKFSNTVFAGQMKLKPQDGIRNLLKNYIVNLEESGAGSLDVTEALKLLEKQRKELEAARKKELDILERRQRELETRWEVLIEERDRMVEEQKRLEKACLSYHDVPVETRRSIWRRILDFFYRLIFGKRLREERRRRAQEAGMLSGKLQQLMEQLGEKEVSLEELSQKLEKLEEEKQQRERQAETAAVTQAMERITSLACDRQGEVLNRLREKASEVLSQITGGRFQKLLLDENLEAGVWNGQRELKPFELSCGCVDQIYLSLRIALQDLFFQEEKMPLFFDEAFVFYDEKRLENILEYLSRMNRQVLLFTCHRWETEALERLGIRFTLQEL